MGTFATNEPRPNGDDSDNTLLYYIARDVNAMADSDSGDATAANQVTEQGLVGALTETAPATDTASSGLNGRLQRIAQRLTSLIAFFGSFLGFTAPRQYAGVPSNFAVATADGTVFTLAAGEIGFIQNLDSADALAVKKGATASTSSFNFILPPGNAADDGKGGWVQIDDWVGVVSVATMTGTGRYIAYKQAAS